MEKDESRGSPSGVVSPWVARLMPWEAGTGWDTDNALSLAEKMTRGCPAGNQGPDTIEWQL